MEKIDSFDREYFFLSNFFPCKIFYEGLEYPSTEHAYQAAKTTDKIKRIDFLCQARTASQAKRLGGKLPLRSDWEIVKIPIMEELVEQKFTEIPDLCELLKETAPAELIEGNNWGDTFWGTVNGHGKNWLGNILMDVRAKLLATDFTDRFGDWDVWDQFNKGG